MGTAVGGGEGREKARGEEKNGGRNVATEHVSNGLCYKTRPSQATRPPGTTSPAP